MSILTPEASTAMPDPRAQREPTALYRLYGADKTLLYIGVSDDPERRFKQHRDTKPWWPQVAQKTIEWHPSRDRALAEEATAIKAETPVHNIEHNPAALQNPASGHWPPAGLAADLVAGIEHATQTLSSDVAERFLCGLAWDFSLAHRDAARSNASGVAR